MSNHRGGGGLEGFFVFNVSSFCLGRIWLSIFRISKHFWDTSLKYILGLSVPFIARMIMGHEHRAASRRKAVVSVVISMHYGLVYLVKLD